MFVWPDGDLCGRNVVLMNVVSIISSVAIFVILLKK